jgi:signal transduction histidine kinase
LRLQKQETENLLRILVHDVANPINAIQLATHAAKNGRRDPEAILNLVDGALDELAAIVQQVRKLRAVKDGKLEMALEQVSVQAALADTVRLLRQPAEHKGIQLDLAMAPEEAWVLADEPLLKNAIFANPISNAIKFSHPGQMVRISRWLTASQVSVTIADEGVGMPEKIRRDIFDATAPTTRIGTGGERGTGYGMPLVKAYVAKLGGDIELVSSQQPNASGTTVTIHLPRCFGYAD